MEMNRETPMPEFLGGRVFECVSINEHVTSEEWYSE
jgi:hypothetical protein